uniref:Uncharacterized protein n=1 Tax=Panagrolaimus sp. JU765 TaxID=591449 RepID=A0AC34RJK6_9BILA
MTAYLYHDDFRVNDRRNLKLFVAKFLTFLKPNQDNKMVENVDMQDLSLNESEKEKARELLRKKQELEEELKRINSQLNQSNESANSSVLFTPVTRRRRVNPNFSPANYYDLQTNYQKPEEITFDSSTAFNLRSHFAEGKKEAFFLKNRKCSLAQIKDPKYVKKTYYLGALYGLVQQQLQHSIRLQEGIISDKISESTVVVYHDNVVNLPEHLARKLTIAALGGRSFVSTVSISPDLAENNENAYQVTAELNEQVHILETVSKYVRQCYATGMPKPLDGRFVGIQISNAQVALDVEDAVLLLGGCPIKVDPKKGIPVGLSHLIHDGKDLRDKRMKYFFKVEYNDFFKHLSIEYDRLKLKSVKF